MKNKLKFNIKIFSRWPIFIVYILLLKTVFGLSYGFPYVCAFVLLLLRISLEKGAFIFFVVAIVLNAFGLPTEANQYISVAYLFLILFLIKCLFFLFRERFSKNV